jgi:hypothetical protein
MRLLDRAHVVENRPWLPAALGAFVLICAFAVALIAPASVRGPLVLGVSSLALLTGYALWPKPALLVFALFVLFYHTLGRWLSPDLRHIDEVVVPTLFVAAAIRTRPWQRGLIQPLREGSLLVMFVAGIGSSLVSGVPFGVWSLGLLLLLKVFAFLYIVMWHDFSAHDIRQFWPLVLGIGVVVLALVPLEAIDPVRFRQVLNLSDISVPREGLPSVKSLFYHPVLFAWFSAFAGLYLVAGYIVLRRWWLLVGAGLFGVGTILAGRRRAIIGLAAALLAGVASHISVARSWRATFRAWWPVATGAAILALAFLPSLLGLVSFTVDPGTVTPTAGSPDARTALYTTSLLIARDDFPFGAGLGRYGSGVSRDPYSPVYRRYGLDTIDGLSPQHSSFVSDTFWPRILGETGVVGLVGLIVFTVVVTAQVWRAARAATTDALTRVFLLGTWMVFVQALIETLASSLFDSPPRIYLLFGVVGMALSLARQPRAEAADSPAHHAASGAAHEAALSPPV